MVVRGASVRVAAVVAVLLGAGAARAYEVGGVPLADRVTIEGRPLALADAGLKQKLWFDVYVWSVYLEKPARSSREAVEADGYKQLTFHLRRDLNREQLVRGIRDGLFTHRAMQGSDKREGLERFLEALRSVNRGDKLVITYVPGEGVHVTGAVRQEAFIPGKAFADALFTAWLDQHPL